MPVLADFRQTVEKPLRIGMFRVLQIGGWKLFHHAPRIHDEHPVAEGRDEAQVVRDKDQPHAALTHQLVENIQHLQLHRDVECRCRLVGDQELRAADQHHGDHDALTHATGNLVRIEIEDTFGIADLHRFEHVERTLLRLGIADPLMGLQRFDDLAPDGHDRIERIFRILQDHRDPLTADRTTLLCRCRQEINIAKAKCIGRNLRMPWC